MTAASTGRWFPQIPRWLLALLVGAATFLLFTFLFDTWTWTGAFVVGALVGLDHGYNLSGRLEAHVRRFEWDKARVALRTLYFSLLIGGVLFLSSLDERMSGDEGSLGLLLALALGGGFICGLMATITETQRECTPDSSTADA